MKYWIENIRGDMKPINDVYVALYIDADVSPVTSDGGCRNQAAQDDITGFRVWRDESDTLWPAGTVLYEWDGTQYVQTDVGDTPKYQSPADYIATGWIADENGTHPVRCSDVGLATSVTGTRVVFPPPEEISYNWWFSDVNDALDWGPYHSEDPSDVDGTPMGDKAKYRIMSNGYFDPDQVCSGELSYPPNVDSINDTRYLLSFGPNDLPAGDTLIMILAYVGGEHFHNGNAWCEWSFDDLAINASWAYRVYDNPGVDTDTNGYAGDFIIAGGETLYISGDGVPDFEGPPPPPTPRLTVKTGDQQVVLNWGVHSETYENKFIPAPYDTDYFEGYRVYRSETGRAGEFTLLAEFDLIDYDTSGTKPLFWNRGMPDKVDDTTYVYVDGPMLNYYPRYYAVTAFDKGFPPGYDDVLSSLETSPLSNARIVTPSPEPMALNQNRKVQVVPNPYKISEDYASIRWEDWEGAGWNEHTRRLDFINLPSVCTIRIYSLNGDLIRTLEHSEKDNLEAGRAASAESWNLITKDVEAVVSGLYLFSVEDKATGKVQVGKFLIIK
jgi:hypothetical protein